MAVDAYDNLGEVREGNEHVPESRMTHEHCEFGIYAMMHLRLCRSRWERVRPRRGESVPWSSGCSISQHTSGETLGG